MTNALVRRPGWLKKRLIVSEIAAQTTKIIYEEGLNTVCSSLLCPNQNECFSGSQATFLLLGDVCTRKCAFCSAKKGIPVSSAQDEPSRILSAVQKLSLKYVVLTSVTRDDLMDGGAAQFAESIASIRRYRRAIGIEVLVPDFAGSERSVKVVVEAGPDVFGHNIETVESLYGTVRRGADYRRSLKLLKFAKAIDSDMLTKSSIMVGLGEREPEILTAIKDLRAVGCDVLTIGQYLSPCNDSIPVRRYVAPDEFGTYKEAALKLGFKYVVSGPFVRSSYMAEEAYRSLRGGKYDRS